VGADKQENHQRSCRRHNSEDLGHDLVLDRGWSTLAFMTIVFRQGFDKLQSRKQIDILATAEGCPLEDLPAKSNDACEGNLERDRQTCPECIMLAVCGSLTMP
jgi:hypothetical protein